MSSAAVKSVPGLFQAATAYVTRGYAVVPVYPRSKRPIRDKWPEVRVTAAQVSEAFEGDRNVGIILGSASGGLTDVDLDCPEAIELAPLFLPHTPVKTGRASKPQSHWWYITQGDQYVAHKDPVSDRMIVELRAAPGHQTVVGPSVHESGEIIDVLEGDPAVVDSATLAAGVAALHAAVVAKRYPDGVPTPPPRANVDQYVATDGPGVPTPAGDFDTIRRAEAYLDRIPSAVSGRGGHNQTYAAATCLVHGFGLDAETALGILMTRYNPRCDPPWTERELRHKVEDAATKPHARPYGWLRDGSRDPRVDLSGILNKGIAMSVSAEGTPADRAQSPDAPASPTIEDPGPFPAHLLEVPGLIGEIVKFDLETAHRPQPVLALAGAIAVQAVLAGRKVCDERGNRTNLYIISVAGTGLGKDHARKLAKRILVESGLEDKIGNEDLASDSGFIAAVKESPAALFLIDEFGKFLATLASPQKAPHLFAIISVMLKMYSCADTIFKGKAYADKAKNPTINQPCPVILGSTVPESFFNALTHESMSDGFMARQIMFVGDKDPPRRRPEMQCLPDSILKTARYWGNLRAGGNLADINPEPICIQATPEASALFDAIGETCDQKRRERRFGSDLWTRVEEKACRLALVYACSASHTNPVIDAAAAQWAIGLAVYQTKLLIKLGSRWVADGFFDARQKRAKRVIEDAGGRMSRSDFARSTQWLNARERQDVVENLVETGQIKIEAVPTATKPKEFYVLIG